jgi:hypothetical protein
MYGTDIRHSTVMISGATGGNAAFWHLSVSLLRAFLIRKLKSKRGLLHHNQFNEIPGNVAGSVLWNSNGWHDTSTKCG